jgi:hypothetical protein
VPAASFATVLDRLIDAGAIPSSPGTAPGISTLPLAVFPWPAPWAARAALPPVTPPARPRRTLSDRQRAALGVLRRCGARLGDDFLLSELKASFHHLARAVHPDRHPNADAGERAQLAARFDEVRQAYGMLRD